MPGKLHIYFYKSEGEWVPFSLCPEDGKKWNVFCVTLALNRPDFPDPTYEDYIDFMISKEF